MMTSATFICMDNILVEHLRNLGIVIWGILRYAANQYTLVSKKNRKDCSNSFVGI